MKISIVGVGRVGSALALILVARELVDELVLVGRTPERTRGEATDLLHATAFGRRARIVAGGAADTAASDVVVLCLGSGPAGADRNASGVANWHALRALVPALVAASPAAILIVATNPVDGWRRSSAA